MSFKWHSRGKTGIELKARRYYSQAVGPDDAHARVVLFMDQNFFFESPALPTRLTEASGNNNDAQNASLTAFFD